MKTLKQLAQESLDVQNACNLSGVVHSFSRAMTDLRAILSVEEGFSTDKLNTHPIAVLYSSKIGSLTGSDNMLQCNQAYDAVMELKRKSE